MKTLIELFPALAEHKLAVDDPPSCAVAYTISAGR